LPQTEGGRRKAEDGRRKTEDGSRKAEDGSGKRRRLDASHTSFMASRHIWASMALLLAAVAWAIALIIKPAPWDIDVAAVVAAGLLVMTAVAVTAILVESSRLGYWLGVSGVGLMLVIAGVREVDPAWVVAISVTGVAGILLADHRLGGWIRAEGPVAPIPAQAAALGLILLVAPIVTALSLLRGSNSAIAWMALSAWVMLVVFVRRWPGAVAVIRLGCPALAAAGAFLGWPAAAIWGILMLLASGLAWSKAVRRAIRPLIERGSMVSIPPELLSDELRRAAGIDRERG
jgi:hypothetical protein